MESQNPSNHGKANKKIKNQTLETKFRFELDLCLKNKDLAAAISLYDSAISHNIRLNHHHFNALLYLCSACVAAPSLRQTLDSSKSFAVEHGFRIFDHMLSGDIRPNEATITAMARVAAAKGDGDFAFDLVKTMNKHYAFPRLRTYDPALICFCENLEVGKAYEVEKHMGMMGVNAEEPELAALLDASAKTGRGDKVYEYLHKLRSSVGCISESTAGIIESWFASEVAAKVEGGNVGAHRIKEAVLRNGCGWHGLGWMGQGKWVVRRSNVDLSGRCCGCGERLVCIDIDREETDNFALSVASLAMEREVKTNFREFQAWLDEHADYEAIVDGANVGLYQQNFAEGGFSVPQSSWMLL